MSCRSPYCAAAGFWDLLIQLITYLEFEYTISLRQVKSRTRFNPDLRAQNSEVLLSVIPLNPVDAWIKEPLEFLSVVLVPAKPPKEEPSVLRQ